MIYDTNLEALQKRYPAIYAKISEQSLMPDADRVSVEAARNGEAVLRYTEGEKECYLNSRYNPSNEADRYMREAFDMPDESILIMFGFSSGSFVRSYIENTDKKTRCIIYEPSMDVFLAVLSRIDISDILLSDRVHIAVKGLNEECFAYAVSSYLQIYNKDTNKHMAAPHYIELFHDDYMEFRRMLIDLYEKLYIITNTAVDRGKNAVRNDIYNMKYLKGCRSTVDLIHAFPEDLPAIVVAAGPSLDKNVSLLAEAKGKALIVVVDTAISRVLKAGVRPDIIIAVDQAKPVKMFTDEGVRELPFVSGMDMNVEVFDYLKPEHLFFSSSDSVIWDDLFRAAGSEIRVVEDGGSVATAAIANLIIWGFRRIIMIGQDLCLTGNRMYAGEGKAKLSDDMDRYTYVKDINGEDSIIPKDYYIYLRWIEEIVARFSDIDFIDATEGGARKKGTRLMTLREVIDEYCNTPCDVENILLSVPRLFEGENEGLVAAALERMKKDFRYMKKQLSACMADCRRGKLILERKENNIKELKRINASIKKTDELIENSDERMYLYKYMADAEVMMMKDMYAEEKDDVKESIRMYEKSEQYYEALVRGIPELIEMIDDCIAQIGEM